MTNIIICKKFAKAGVEIVFWRPKSCLAEFWTGFGGRETHLGGWDPLEGCDPPMRYNKCKIEWVRPTWGVRPTWVVATHLTTVPRNCVLRPILIQIDSKKLQTASRLCSHISRPPLRHCFDFKGLEFSKGPSDLISFFIGSSLSNINEVFCLGDFVRNQRYSLAFLLTSELMLVLQRGS